MNRYQAAERTARAVHSGGWNNLSYTEEALLSKDTGFHNEVVTLVSKLNRAELLQTEKGSKKRLIPNEILDSDSNCEEMVDWGDQGTMRRAELWVHRKTKNAVLEIKQWSETDYYNAINIGSHNNTLISIDYEKTKDLKKKIINNLERFGCPKLTIDNFIKKI